MWRRRGPADVFTTVAVNHFGAQHADDGCRINHAGDCATAKHHLRRTDDAADDTTIDLRCTDDAADDTTIDLRCTAPAPASAGAAAAAGCLAESAAAAGGPASTRASAR